MKTDMPFWLFTNTIEKLDKILTCPKIPRCPQIPGVDDRDTEVWIIQHTNIQFKVAYIGYGFNINIGDDRYDIDSEETDDPERVIQKAKDFKSKYLE